MVCYHIAKFRGHWYFISGGIMFLVCDMAKQDHLIKA